MNLLQAEDAISTLQRAGFEVTKPTLQHLDRHFRDSGGRLVMVMSHTGWQDFWLGLLLFNCGSIPITMYMNPRSRWWRWMGTKLGMVVGQKGMSNTTATIRALEHKKEFGLLMSLSKTTLGTKRVHSGYFHLAKALKARIIVLGFDYFRACGCISEDYWTVEPNETYEEFQAAGKEQAILAHIAHIHPLKPRRQVAFDRERYMRDLSPSTCRQSMARPNPAFLAALWAKQHIERNGLPVVAWVTLGVVIVTMVLLWTLVTAVRAHRRRRIRVDALLREKQQLVLPI
jgi:hypothetical protein